MSFVGGLMKNIVKAVSVAGAAEVISKTDTAGRVIDEATRRAEAAADFLKGIEDFVKREDEER